MKKELRQNKFFDFTMRTLIVGMGNTGLSCARFLKKNNCSFAFADSRSNVLLIASTRKEFSQTDYILGEFDLDVFGQYQQIIVSPGVSIRNDLFRQLQINGCYILGDIELFAQVVDKPVIAITGSNGKSTVTTLVEKIANHCAIKTIAGGNLGLPALDMLETESDLYILELSSFQLETTMSLQTLSATVLNVSEDHMDRYDDLEDYRKVKETIYHNTATAVVNQAEKITLEQVVASQSDENYSIILFGELQPESHLCNDKDYALAYVDNELFLMKGRQKIIASSELKLKSKFNYVNVLAALALLEPLKLDKEKQIEAIIKFTGLEHRCEWVAEINNVQFYNDSKGTNTGATIAAIEGFDDALKVEKTTILIAGGVGKDADFTGLAYVIKTKIKSTVLLGTDANIIKDCALQAGAENDSLYSVASMQEAVLTAQQVAEPGDVVLFSPACASFDMYQNYQQRGDDFKEKVMQAKVLKNVS
ncbi:MAG: UDP-N-acetylmuramoyl-L-alanine--D-glutamate ligase [gamma proteobacterium symbiont of Taylorina sp.]|nr:UDP-N-acetylmuramoyl-L-alanine--D-glutamate ligase [gamma proteobacterium symbiont of Taylorina sp.]